MAVRFAASVVVSIIVAGCADAQQTPPEISPAEPATNTIPVAAATAQKLSQLPPGAVTELELSDRAAGAFSLGGQYDSALGVSCRAARAVQQRTPSDGSGSTIVFCRWGDEWREVVPVVVNTY